MAHIHDADRVVKNISLMIHLSQVLKMEIIANTQYVKGIGPIVPELAGLLAGVPCPDKTEFNGLANSDVREMLDGLPPSVDTLLLCGVETHICIYQTAMGALQAGYNVRVVADAVSSRTQENDQYGQQRLREIGTVLAPAEMVLYDLLQKAGTAEFKAMLPHIK
jgi:hypothetical protein